MSELERDVSPAKTGNGQSEQTKVVKFQRAAMICGLLVRNFDYETLLSDQGDRIDRIMIRILKESNQNIKKISMHFSTVMATEGPCNEAFFDMAFPLSYHLLQQEAFTPDAFKKVAIAGLVNTQVRMCDEVAY